MEKFEWTDELKVGIELFDKQHKKWIQLAQQVAKNLEAEPDKEELLKAADDEINKAKTIKNAFIEFIKYSREHLQAEEEKMREHNFPGYEEHRAEHNKYRGLIQKIKKQYEKDKQKGIRKLVRFLEEWLLKHIKETDKKYSDYFPSRFPE